MPGLPQQRVAQEAVGFCRARQLGIACPCHAQLLWQLRPPGWSGCLRFSISRRSLLPFPRNPQFTTGLPSWLNEDSLDLSRVPIGSIFQQSLSANEDLFRDGCKLLNSLCHGGRVEAGVFLLGLLRQNSDNYARLTAIAEALTAFPTAATVDALASELLRVKGSNATRGYLRRIIDTLEHFPDNIAQARILELSSDPRIGTRFRRRLQSIAFGTFNDW